MARKALRIFTQWMVVNHLQADYLDVFVYQLLQVETEGILYPDMVFHHFILLSSGENLSAATTE